MPQRYVYGCRKVAGKVQRYYIGTEDSPAAESHRRELARRRRLRAQLKIAEAVLQELERSDDDLHELETVAMEERGYERTESRKWRIQQ